MLVKWLSCNALLVGVVMDQQEPTPDWAKRKDRRQVRVTAVAYLPDGSAVAVRVTNISYEGCELETNSILPIGEKLKIALPRLGEIYAQVRWALEGKAGIQFLLEEAVADERRSRIRV